MHYFSYGSNMSIRRLHDRVPSASKLGAAILHGHELNFHKVGYKDHSAKCDATVTGNPAHFVVGVVFDISEIEKPELDRKEGLGYGYEQKDVLVKLEDGTMIETFTYYATEIDPDRKPLAWYKEHVVRGARENGFPEEYILKIESIESDPDHDTERHERELSIYID